MKLPKPSLRRSWHWFQKNLLVFIFVGVWVLVMLFINFNGKVARNTADTHAIVEGQAAILKQLNLNDPDSNLSKLQANGEHDHDVQLTAVKCIVNLFGSYPGQIITDDQFNKCLAGTRIDPATSTVQPVPQKVTPQNSPQNSSNTNTPNNTSNQNSSTNNSQPGLAAKSKQKAMSIINSIKELVK